MTRGLPVLLLLATACTDRDASRPPSDLGSPPPAVAARPVVPSSVAATADPNDPAEPGISDLARLARYVFLAMQRHEQVCPLENPFREELHFAFMVEVKGGRMPRVALSEVAVQGSGAKRPLPRAQRPPEVARYLTCLEPHLKAMAMSPAPADGLYEPAYSLGGRATGRTAP